MISTKINTNDSSNPLDKQFICGIRFVHVVFYMCVFVVTKSFSLAPYNSCSLLSLVWNSFTFLFLCVFHFSSVSFSTHTCLQKRSQDKAKKRHDNVMRLLVRRYITAEQRKRDDYGITEDDVMEIRQDISTLRFELIDILSSNGMKTPNVNQKDVQCKVILLTHFSHPNPFINTLLCYQFSDIYI